MKFEFCGKLDCPDWILAQLYHASKLDLRRFEIICASVRDTILNGGALNELDLFERLGLYEATNGQVSGQIDIDDARTCFGALNFIMANACLYRVPIKQLRNELEQLGLASEHCELVCRILEATDPQELRAKLS